jgi:hypothetical protein
MNEINVIRLLLGAERAEIEHVEIAAEYVPQIEAARAKLALMTGTSVFNAVVNLRRSGLNPAPDLRKLERNSIEYEAEKRDRSRLPGAMHQK